MSIKTKLILTFSFLLNREDFKISLNAGRIMELIS